LRDREAGGRARARASRPARPRRDAPPRRRGAARPAGAARPHRHPRPRPRRRADPRGAAGRRLPRRGAQARAPPRGPAHRGGAHQRARHLQHRRRRGRVRRRPPGLHLLRQGGPAVQRPRLLEVARRAARAPPGPAGLPLVLGAVRQRPRQPGQRHPHLRAPDRRGWPGHGDRPPDDPLLHERARVRAASAAGCGTVRGRRRDLHARDGGAGEHPRAGRAHGAPLGPPGRDRDPHPVLGPAPRREAGRGPPEPRGAGQPDAAPLDRAAHAHPHRGRAPRQEHPRDGAPGGRAPRPRGDRAHGRPRQGPGPPGGRRPRESRSEGRMEPLDYLKVLQRHWKVVVALVVVVLVGVYFVAPTGPATEYEATHRLLRDQASGDEGVSSADNPAVVELWVTQGEVPNRVKEVLGYSGSPDELVADLEVTSSLGLGIVEITARAESPDEAITLANTFADETLKFIDEHTSNRQQEQAAQANERAEEIRGRINELDSQIAAQGGDDAPGAADLVRERDGLIEQLGTVEQSATATGTTSWISLNEATRAEKASTS